MEQFSIRPMQESDIPAVILVEHQIYEFPWSDRNFLDSLRAGYSLNCLWDDQQLCGYIVMMKVVDEHHLLNISIRADLQGQGHGKALLRWGMAQALAAKSTGMLLEVRPSNEVARTLYEQEGFKLIGTRKNYYPARSGREDALVFFRRFEQESH